MSLAARISATSSISCHPFTPCGLSPSHPAPDSSAWPTGISPRPLPCASSHGRPSRVAHAHALCTLVPLPGNRGGGQEEVGVPASPLSCPPVPLGPPENVSAMRNGSQALVRWQEPRAPLQGTLLGYRLAYRGQDTPEVGAAGGAGEEWPGGERWGGDGRADRTVVQVGVVPVPVELIVEWAWGWRMEVGVMVRDEG